MHRHGYQGRKLHRERDQRRALVKSLAESLIIHQSIETTLPKAKEVVPYVEKLITKAKKGDLASRRRVIAGLQTVSSAHKLVDQLAPKMAGRPSGHLRVVKTGLRRGDNAQLAKVSFVDDLSQTNVPETVAKPTTASRTMTKAKDPAKKPAFRTVAKKPATKRPGTTKKAPAAKKETK